MADGSDEGADWEEKEISLINLITTNLDYLGVKHPIYPDVKPDDGRLVMAYIDGLCSRNKTVKLGLGMKKGNFLIHEDVSKLERGLLKCW